VISESAHPERDDLAAYSLDALDPEEAARVERHLESCDRCRTLVLWLRPAVDLLPASVEQLEPPPTLRERVLAEVNAEAAPQHGGEVDRGPRELAAARPRRKWRVLDWRPAVAIAAVLLVVGALGGYLLRSSGPSQSVVAARPTNAAPSGQVSATLAREGDLATLRVTRLPALPPDAVYETWVERDGAVRPGSVFVLRDDGSADAAVPGPLGGADAVLVTREPRGGSTTPTSPPLLRASLG
jgi:anti-sigma-K factor RskA